VEAITLQRFAQRFFWFGFGLALGGVTISLAMASVPSNRGGKTRVTDDTVIYQNLSEIRVPKEKAPNFDSDIEKLSSMEHRYKEKLPPRLVSPIQRISHQKYKYSGSKSKAPRVSRAKSLN
jgi:hypothetical protein